MKCDELKRKYSDITGPYYGCNEVDEAIDELKKKLMPCLNGDCILTCEVVEKYGKENAELKADYKEACGRLQTANLIKDEQLAATRHSNYKRCLAMAQWCMDAECKTEKDADFLVRWEFRWLALAEEPTWAKFLQLIHKEAK